eukprot:TRINITY_DN1404_c1_g1_i1.p1 TRINITY_DN1404_c1_g1~~TRINITY_DN1404_c1_g1_i1.p1  ORF type:complete len:1200 (-),score=233.53 TRINITY_DN1404_c1_g1_i1:657-4256(-)
MQAVPGMPAVQVAQAQSQAALRQQLQMQQQQQFFVQQQMQQQQQQQQILQARLMMQRQHEQQRLQNRQPQQPQLQPNVQSVQQSNAQNKPQESTRNSNAASKRSPSGADGKKKPNASAAKTTAAPPTSTSAGSRGKVQMPNIATDPEAFRRALQMHANQAVFTNAQALANLPPSARQEYLRTLAHQQAAQLPMTSQVQVSAALQAAAHQPVTSQQVSQAQQFPQPGLIPDMSVAQQQASQALSASMGVHAANRVSQGIHHGVNMQAQNRMMMNPRAAAVSTSSQYALIARAANAMGMNVTAEQLSRFNREQLAQFLALLRTQNSMNNNAAIAAQQRQNMVRMNEAQAHMNMGTAPAADDNNAAKWIGPPGNKPGAAGQGVMNTANNVNRAIAMEKQKHAQRVREQLQFHQHDQQNAAAHANVASLAAHAKRPTGMTQAQVNALLASQQKVKLENANVIPRDKQHTLAQAIQNASQAQNVRALAGANAGMVPNNVGMTPMNPAASEAVPTADKAAHSNSAQDELFWNKLEEIQAKYLAPLQQIVPIIQKIHPNDTPRKEQFFKFLQDCIMVLQLKRGSPKPERVDYGVLQRTETFLNNLIQVYTQNHAKRGPNLREGLESNAAAVAAATAAAAGKAAGQPPNAQTATGVQGVHVKAETASGHANIHRLNTGHLPQAPQQPPQTKAQHHAQHRMQQLALRQQQHTYQYQDQQRLKLLNDLNLQANQQLPSAVHQRQGRAGIAAAATGVDVSKIAAARQAEAHANRVASARGRPPPQRAAARVQGVAGVAGTTAASQQHVARIVEQMRMQQSRAAAQADVHMKNRAQAAQVAAHQPVVAPTQAQAQAMANQQLHHMQAATRMQHQPSVANLRTNAGGARSRVDTGVRAGAGVQGAKHLDSWGGAQGTNTSLAVSNGGRRGATNEVRVANGMNGANMAVGSNGSSATNVNAASTQSGVLLETKNRTEMDPPGKMAQIIALVKDVSGQVNFLEQSWETEAKRQKSERIQITLAALRSSASASASDEAEKKGFKRKTSLADVENYEGGGGVIETKTVFECSPETGLRLAKKPRLEAGDMQLLREAVKRDVKAAKEKNPRLSVWIVEEFGHPVVVCMLKIAEMRLPKLMLRVQRGYPRKGGARYGFERPPMGWVGLVEEVRKRFKKELSISPAASVGVAVILNAWASQAEAVLNGSEVSDQTKVTG